MAFPVDPSAIPILDITSRLIEAKGLIFVAHVALVLMLLAYVFV